MKKLILGFAIIFCLFVLAGMFGFTNISPERYVEFDYNVNLDHIPKDTTDLNIWLPLMPESKYQTVEETAIEPQDGYRITSDKAYDNKILHYAYQSPQTPLHIKVHYKVRRREYSNQLQERPSQESPEELSKYLQPSRLATISPRVQKLASQVTKGKKDTMDKAKAIYDYVFQNVSYDKTIPGWGNGDTERYVI